MAIALRESSWAYSHLTPIEARGIDGSKEPVAEILEHLHESQHIVVARAEAPKGISWHETRDGGLDVSELAITS